jgi:SAM-dependent methyltransferase
MLDVATGSGGMIRYLVDHLKGYDEAIGIDVDDANASEFHDKFADEPRIRFETMDALAMAYPPGSFDIVSMAHSLCEFTDADRIKLLQAMVRLIRAGGAFIISDSPRDQTSEPEMTHVLLHDWWSEVDAHNGVLHEPFQRRVELISQFEALNLVNLRLFDVPATYEDPFDATQLTLIDGVIDRSLEKVADAPTLAARGNELRERMHRLGFRLSTALVAFGEIAPAESAHDGVDRVFVSPTGADKPALLQHMSRRPVVCVEVRDDAIEP